MKDMYESININDDKPKVGDNCEICFGCVHRCKNNVISLNKEAGIDRFLNEHIKLFEIIKSNNIRD